MLSSRIMCEEGIYFDILSSVFFFCFSFTMFLFVLFFLLWLPFLHFFYFSYTWRLHFPLFNCYLSFPSFHYFPLAFISFLSFFPISFLHFFHCPIHFLLFPLSDKIPWEIFKWPGSSNSIKLNDDWSQKVMTVVILPGVADQIFRVIFQCPDYSKYKYNEINNHLKKILHTLTCWPNFPQF